MVLSSSINTFSIEVPRKKNNQRTNPLYDKECKNVKGSTKEAIKDFVKIDKINRYKALNRRKKTTILYK